MSCKHSRVFPVWVHQEAGEGAVCLGAGVKSIVFWQSHLDPHLVTRNEVEQGAPGQRCWFGPVAVELKVRCYRVCVLHQVKLEAGSVDCGVDCKVVNSRDFAGEAPRVRVVVTLFVEYDLVKANDFAYSEGQSETLGQFSAERRLWGDCTFPWLPPLSFLPWVTSVPHQASKPCLTCWRSRHEHPLPHPSHTHRLINHMDHLCLLCRPSVLSPQEQHLSRPCRLSRADRDCHELQESLGYQGDQCTDWVESCCLLTGWKDGFGGQGGSAAGVTAGVRSLLCCKLREKQEAEKQRVSMCGLQRFVLDSMQWDSSHQIKQKFTTKVTINITSKQTSSVCRGWGQPIQTHWNECYNIYLQDNIHFSFSCQPFVSTELKKSQSEGSLKVNLTVLASSSPVKWPDRDGSHESDIATGLLKTNFTFL